MITILPGILSQRAGYTYAVLQDLTTAVPISGGNLTFLGTSANAGTTIANIGKSSGKWYWEVRINAANATAFSGNVMVGAVNYTPATNNTTNMHIPQQGVSWRGNGQSYCIAKNITGSVTTQGTGCGSFQLTVGTIVSFALDMDSGVLKIYINGTQRGGDVTGLTGTYYPAVGSQGFPSSGGTCNFGQNAWSTNVTVTATRATLITAGYNMGIYNI